MCQHVPCRVSLVFQLPGFLRFIILIEIKTNICHLIVYSFGNIVLEYFMLFSFMGEGIKIK